MALILKGTVVGSGLRQFMGVDKVVKYRNILQVLVDKGNDGLVEKIDVEEKELDKRFPVGKEIEIPVWVNAYAPKSGGAVVQFHTEGVYQASAAKGVKV